MKAIRIHSFGDTSVLQLEEFPSPALGESQVLVQIKAIGVNPVDTYIRSGKYGPRTFPHTLGFDAAGVIKLTGSEVQRFRVGDRVYVAGSVSGTYAEEVLCDVAQVHPLPDAMSFEQGAAIGVPYATAYAALTFRGKAQPNETLFIHGATGSVGLAAVQLAALFSLTVIGTGGTPTGRDQVRAQGADHVLDHHATDYLDEVMRITEGHGADLILEMLANVNLAKDLKVVAKLGRVVVIGNRGTIEIDPRDIMSRNASILGMSLFNLTPDEYRLCHAELAKGLKQRVLNPVVGKQFSLAEAKAAHVAVMEPGAQGKIVLIP